jgi:nicotinate-nucleotide adenylyltransferase
MNSRRICLFGGSFNPPHVCHVLASTWALAALPIDELWWVPTWQHAFGKQLESFEHRFELVRRAIEPFGNRMQVTDVEAELGGESRTIRTVRELSRQHPHHRFSLLVGEDLVDQMPRWQQWGELSQLVDVFVIGRWGTRSPGIDSGFALPSLSSTAIRDAIRRADHAWLATRVPAAVLDYIHAEQLYRDLEPEAPPVFDVPFPVQ